MIVQQATLLEVATRTLLAHPSASLSEIAEAAGISRTTLHARFPTREALLAAMAHDAMDVIETVYAGSGLDSDAPVESVLGQVVHGILPLGPRVEFLLRERSLDTQTSVTERYDRLDTPLIDYLEGAQSRGELVRDVPAWWIAWALLGTVHTAWEAVADGRLAVRDAPRLILATLLNGIRP